jgi:uncharacterized protein
MGIRLYGAVFQHAVNGLNALAAEIPDHVTGIMLKKARALLYVSLGHFFLLIGLIGVFLPVLPTTPFVLLASWCYSRSSKRFHGWIRDNKLFGTYIREWEQHRSIPVRAKALALTMIGASGVIVWLTVGNGAARVAALLTMVIVSIYILTRPSR